MDYPIRILHVVTIMNRAGIETLLMNLYREIDKSKVQFDFLVHNESRGDYDNEIRKLGGRIHYLHKINILKPKVYLKYLQDFFSKHQEYKIVHSHLNTFSKYVLKAASREGVKVKIAHSHAAFPGLSIKTFIKAMTRINIKKYSDYKFACSKDAAKWVFGTTNKVTIFANAIESKKFIYSSNKREEIRKKMDINKDTLVIGNVGRFSKSKNHEFILDIFKYINNKKCNSVLILIGKGELEEQINNKINRLGISENVRILGTCSNVNDYMQAMDIFLFPSKSEGLGIVAIEAQASGLKVIASDKVPKETNITNLINYFPLKCPAKTWGDWILDCSNKYPRNNMYKSIISEGYDIEKNIIWLQEFYLKSI